MKAAMNKLIRLGHKQYEMLEFMLSSSCRYPCLEMYKVEITLLSVYYKE